MIHNMSTYFHILFTEEDDIPNGKLRIFTVSHF